MVEIVENELRIDDKVLKYVTDEEMKKLREITKTISVRVKENGKE